MKATLCLGAVSAILLLGSITIGVGQGSSMPGFEASQEDHGCNSTMVNCDLDLDHMGDCTVLQFQGTFNGPAHLEGKVVCPSERDCAGCFFCAYVFNLSDHVFEAHTESPNNPCDRSCDGVAAPQFQMHNGDEYRLIVCLRGCSGHCEDCPEDCYATAQVIAE